MCWQVYQCASHLNCEMRLRVRKQDGELRAYPSTATHANERIVEYTGTTISAEFVEPVKALMSKGKGPAAILLGLQNQFGADEGVVNRLPTLERLTYYTRNKREKSPDMQTLWDALSWGTDPQRFVRNARELKQIKNLNQVLVLEVRGRHVPYISYLCVILWTFTQHHHSTYVSVAFILLHCVRTYNSGTVTAPITRYMCTCSVPFSGVCMRLVAADKPLLCVMFLSMLYDFMTLT